MTERASILAPFRHDTFRMLWLGTLISNLGGLVQAVGAGWMMTTLTTSHNMVALVQASNTLPIMVFSIAAGALADNFDRRSVMLVAQCGMAMVSLALAVTAFMGLLNPWLLLTFTFLIGCGTALFNPSWQASMGDIVPREDLAGAVTLNAMGFNMMRSVGPAVGGLIVAFAGASAAFAVNAATYMGLIAALLRWKPERSKPRLPRETLGSAMGAGIRYVSMSPNLLTVLFRGLLFGFAAIVVLALLPVVAEQYVGGGALVYGTLLGAFGLGAIGGAFLNGRMRARFGNEAIVRLASLGFAAAMVGLAFSRDPLLSHFVLLPAGACWVLSLSLFNVSIQLSAPRWVVGRALSLYQTATFGGMAAGSWIWGITADAWGPNWALVAAACVLVLCAAVGLRLPLPQFNDRDLNPLDTFNEPMLKLDLRPRSGPILIMVDYRIAQSDIPRFLGLMSERRRIRIRDGARQWSLLRDLEQPDLWVESYHVPTWVDYVRHNLRRTKADADNIEQLRALHQGADLPVVHRMIERQTVPLDDRTPLRDSPEVAP
ncbi:Predicted arabinose efflux permease, MFS family [Devosia crocina]|uniref:Predicted arabinose efflux permease, MFS family n=1 Tax=Devosia crocina TaxID=429728 RepID=A0A1I7N654_9HYPH|nr:MFS transporter [Devosia crocina]SFV30132.1 Predicted arabinose efflux permease, MFS family [Devosia crocina]